MNYLTIFIVKRKRRLKDKAQHHLARLQTIDLPILMGIETEDSTIPDQRAEKSNLNKINGVRKNTHCNKLFGSTALARALNEIGVQTLSASIFTILLSVADRLQHTLTKPVKLFSIKNLKCSDQIRSVRRETTARLRTIFSKFGTTQASTRRICVRTKKKDADHAHLEKCVRMLMGKKSDAHPIRSFRNRNHKFKMVIKVLAVQPHAAAILVMMTTETLGITVINVMIVQETEDDREAIMVE